MIVNIIYIIEDNHLYIIKYISSINEYYTIHNHQIQSEIYYKTKSSFEINLITTNLRF